MEQTKSTPAFQGDKEERASYGKFNKLEDLINAYNSLEAEFTKRSQRLKELENKKNQKNQWQNKVQSFMEKYPIAAEFTEQIGEEIAQKDLIKEEDCLEKALLSVLTKNYKPPKEQAKDQKVIEELLRDDSFKEKIIQEYRQKISNNPLPKTLPGGGKIPVATPCRPTTIKEAGQVALELLKQL